MKWIFKELVSSSVKLKKNFFFNILMAVIAGKNTSEKHDIEQGEQTFSKGSDVEYLRLCRPNDLHLQYLTLPL